MFKIIKKLKEFPEMQSKRSQKTILPWFVLICAFYGPFKTHFFRNQSKFLGQSDAVIEIKVTQNKQPNKLKKKKV